MLGLIREEIFTDRGAMTLKWDLSCIARCATRSATMGAIGYLFGKIVVANPIFTAKLFAIHELARNLFLVAHRVYEESYTGDDDVDVDHAAMRIQRFKFRALELSVNTCFDVAALILIGRYQLINGIALGILSASVFAHLLERVFIELVRA